MATPAPRRRVRFTPRTTPVPEDYDTGACRCSTITTHRGTPAEHRRQQCIDARESQPGHATS